MTLDDAHGARERARRHGPLGYATWLSLRVRRLAHAAETALGPQGEIRAEIPGRGRASTRSATSRAASRRLLERLREHTEYLRTLASKLSHELRTPLAVVSRRSTTSCTR